MKIVREHINEKFAEQGDPIQDMGIGLAKGIILKAKEMFLTSQLEYDQEDTELEIIEISFDSFFANIITNNRFDLQQIKLYVEDYLQMADLDKFFDMNSVTYTEYPDNIFWCIDFKEKYELIFKDNDIVINYKTINEIG